MKIILIMSLLLITTLGFSDDRFYSEAERTEALFAELKDGLEKVTLELEKLNEHQTTIIDLLNSINQVGKGWDVVTRSQNPATLSND